MPFLNVTIPLDLPVNKETILWQVDWRRALGSEDQISRLQKATGATTDFGGKNGFELRNDAGERLDLGKTPTELQLEKNGTIKLIVHLKRPPPLQTLRASMSDEESTWRPEAIAVLLETSGRIPDWRDRIRKRSDPTQTAFIRSRELDPHSGLQSIMEHRYSDAPGTDTEAVFQNAGSPNNFYLERISRRPRGPHTPDDPTYAEVPSDTHHQIMSLDHVPGFQLGDKVQAIAVEEDMTLNGKHGTVVGCEMVGKILFVEVEFDGLGRRLVMTRNLQNLTEIGLDHAD
eukprot:TRINITY_DN34941_c0_g1_i1.p1 TRINITY_DN34941_c0_g1~~TRINITY_DN34941_c0_g1_i1.p1  ORF type:complete len:287 (+),score=32.77 TRINITY_DN34941_c0_g1_i1:77-937(+)